MRAGPAAVHAVVEPAAGRISELDIAGGLRGEPIDVIRGPYTGFPIPADAEIVLEGETVPGQCRPEGPFGEWMGYYSDDTEPGPTSNIKTILYRNNPILSCAPQHKPVDETGLLKGIAGAAQIWRSLEACGLPIFSACGTTRPARRRALPSSRSSSVIPASPQRAACRLLVPGRRLCGQMDRRGR